MLAKCPRPKPMFVGKVGSPPHNGRPFRCEGPVLVKRTTQKRIGGKMGSPKPTDTYIGLVAQAPWADAFAKASQGPSRGIKEY